MAKKTNKRGRPHKEYKYFNTKLDKSIFEALTALCEDTGLTKTKACERALSAYIATYKTTGKS